MFRTLSIIPLMAMVSGLSLAAGNAEVGKSKSAVCSSCHGPAGISNSPLWPNLAGQKQEYLAKQLRDFKAQKRSDPMMTPMAMPLSEQDIADLAAYYASLSAN